MLRSVQSLCSAATLLMAAFCPSSVWGQVGPMNFVYSYSNFSYTDSTSLLEFDYQFSDRGVTYVEQQGGSAGKLLTLLTVYDTLNHIVFADRWITTSQKAADPEATEMLLGSRLIAVRPGSYHAHLYYEDVANKSNRDSADFPMRVRSFVQPRLQLSDIQIAADISESSDGANQFYRNGYIVIPNVAGSIADPFLVLNTYLEVYNADHVPTSEYSVSYGLADSARKMIYQQDLKRSRPAGAAVVELNSIPLEELPSGDYYLVVKAYNGLMRSATDSAMVARRFSLYNPRKDSILAAAHTSVASSLPADIPADPIYSGMRESELDREYSKVKYIAVPAEKKIWNDLNGTDAKARFLTLFWLKRDPSPGTPENENRDDYFKRVDKAQHLYSSSMTPDGWDSDRGRILLQFGAPDVEERHFQDYNRKPFETWKYAQMGYEFDFVDRSQTGTFVLVHSTAPGEVRDENWETDYAMIDPHFQNR